MFLDRAFVIFEYFFMPIWIAFNVNLNVPLTDGFHEGEYIGNVETIKAFQKGLAEFPILIHGAMDYIPALIASSLSNGDYVIFYTRLLNTLAVAICWILYLAISKNLSSKSSQKQLWRAIFFCCFFIMSVASGDDPVKKQQAFLGTRDLFLISCIWASVRAIYSERAIQKIFFNLVAGISASAALFWAYDRAILTLTWSAIFTSVNVFQKRTATLVWFSLGFLGFIATTHFTLPWIDFSGSVRNILYWLKNSNEIWHFPFSSKIPAIPSMMGMFTFSALSIYYVMRSLRTENKKDISLKLGFACIQVLFLIKMYQLPPFPNTYYFIWPSLLIAMTTATNFPYYEDLNSVYAKFLTKFYHCTRNCKLVEVGYISSLILILISNYSVSTLLNVRKFFIPSKDSQLIDANHFGYSTIKSLNFDCIFLWSNEGVFPLLSKMRYCTKHQYGVYISSNDEALILNSFSKKLPGLIVYDSPAWSMNIYGRSMKDRLPNIDQFIRKNYRFHISENGYTFAIPKEVTN